MWWWKENATLSVYAVTLCYTTHELFFAPLQHYYILFWIIGGLYMIRCGWSFLYSQCLTYRLLVLLEIDNFVIFPSFCVVLIGQSASLWGSFNCFKCFFQQQLLVQQKLRFILLKYRKRLTSRLLVPLGRGEESRKCGCLSPNDISRNASQSKDVPVVKYVPIAPRSIKCSFWNKTTNTHVCNTRF